VVSGFFLSQDKEVFAMVHIEEQSAPRVAVIMGSRSDWETLCYASRILTELGIRHENKIISAHRTPDLLFEYVGRAEARGIQIIIAGAGGADLLPGMAAAKTTLPMLGVPVQSRALNGLDSLLSIVQMPKGIPVGTLAIGDAGATNAALFAAAILALSDPVLRERLQQYRERQTARVLEQQL
jgi:5-(carboxyamino)imidazole ribonucleotide mutase